jgi:hypothetical protein
MTMTWGGVSMVVAALPLDEPMTIDVFWDDRTQTLAVGKWRSPLGQSDDSGSHWELAFAPAKPAQPPPASSEGADRLCACEKEVAGDATCADFVGAPDHDCEHAYENDCKRLLECARGDPASPPVCQHGWKRAGVTQRCFRSCDEDDPSPCAVGACTSVDDVGKVCM